MVRKSVTDKKKLKILAALELTLGVISPACKNAEVSRDQYYKWLKEDPEFKHATEHLPDLALDFAESHLHKQMKDGVAASTIFYLKTKGKKRGFVERQEVEVSGGLTVNWNETKQYDK